VAHHGPTDLVVSPDEPDYWDYRQFLMFGEATLAAPLNGVVGTAFRAPSEEAKKNFTDSLIRELFRKRLAVVSKRLKDREYITAGRFTLADISVVYPLTVALKAEVLCLKDDIPEDLAAYAARLMSRPAFRRMVVVR
jgi:glutathione S-transferase